MLGRPAAPAARAVVIGPDDLVEEVLATEDLVEQQLAVVRLAVVDVEVERARLVEQSVRVSQARFEEGEEVRELVGVRGLGQQACRVAAARETDSIALIRLLGLQRSPVLALARVERRVDVDQLKMRVGQLGQQLEVVAVEDRVVWIDEPHATRQRRRRSGRQ